MRPHERLELARASYVRAINRARGGPTPASWRRVLAAARNLAQARRDEARSRVGSPPCSPREMEPRPAAGSRRCRIFMLSREPDEAGVRAVCAWPVLSDA